MYDNIDEYYPEDKWEYKCNECGFIGNVDYECYCERYDEK